MHIRVNGCQADKVLKVYRIKCYMNVWLNVAFTLMCFEWSVRQEKHYRNVNPLLFPFSFPFGQNAKYTCPRTSLCGVLETNLTLYCQEGAFCISSIPFRNCLSCRFNMFKQPNNPPPPLSPFSANKMITVFVSFSRGK